MSANITYKKTAEYDVPKPLIKFHDSNRFVTYCPCCNNTMEGSVDTCATENCENNGHVCDTVTSNQRINGYCENPLMDFTSNGCILDKIILSEDESGFGKIDYKYKVVTGYFLSRDRFDNLPEEARGNITVPEQNWEDNGFHAFVPQMTDAAVHVQTPYDIGKMPFRHEEDEREYSRLLREKDRKGMAFITRQLPMEDSFIGTVEVSDEGVVTETRSDKKMMHRPYRKGTLISPKMLHMVGHYPFDPDTVNGERLFRVAKPMDTDATMQVQFDALSHFVFDELCRAVERQTDFGVTNHLSEMSYEEFRDLFKYNGDLNDDRVQTALTSAGYNATNGNVARGQYHVSMDALESFRRTIYNCPYMASAVNELVGHGASLSEAVDLAVSDCTAMSLSTMQQLDRLTHKNDKTIGHDVMTAGYADTAFALMNDYLGVEACRRDASGRKMSKYKNEASEAIVERLTGIAQTDPFRAMNLAGALRDYGLLDPAKESDALKCLDVADKSILSHAKMLSDIETSPVFYVQAFMHKFDKPLMYKTWDTIEEKMFASSIYDHMVQNGNIAPVMPFEKKFMSYIAGQVDMSDIMEMDEKLRVHDSIKKLVFQGHPEKIHIEKTVAGRSDYPYQQLMLMADRWNTLLDRAGTIQTDETVPFMARPEVADIAGNSSKLRKMVGDMLSSHGAPGDDETSIGKFYRISSNLHDLHSAVLFHNNGGTGKELVDETFGCLKTVLNEAEFDGFCHKFSDLVVEGANNDISSRLLKTQHGNNFDYSTFSKNGKNVPWDFDHLYESKFDATGDAKDKSEESDDFVDVPKAVPAAVEDVDFTQWDEAEDVIPGFDVTDTVADTVE